MSDNKNIELLEASYKKIIESIGEDTNRDGLLKTPLRAAKAIDFLTSGYNQNLIDVVNDAIYESSNKDLVLVKNINFFSICEHHLLPFYGTCNIAYIPNGKVLGLSKFGRIVDMFSRRLQIQEQLTEQIANAIIKTNVTVDVAVHIKAKHLCMMMRGVQKSAAEMETLSTKGQLQSSEYKQQLATKFNVG